MDRKSDNWSNCTNIAAPQLFAPSLRTSLRTSPILVLRHTVAAFVKRKGPVELDGRKHTRASDARRF